MHFPRTRRFGHIQVCSFSLSSKETEDVEGVQSTHG